MAGKKGLPQLEPSKKWLFGPGPLGPMPPGMSCKPWLMDREKLPSRYCATYRHKYQRPPISLDSRRWIFVKEGLDDFRTGCPSSDNMITRATREGFLPMIAHRVPRPPPTKPRRKLPKGAELLSKLSPAQRARKAFVKDVEASLTQHPLDGHPNLEKDLPVDLLIEVMELLDPDRKLKDVWTCCQSTREEKMTPTELCEKHPHKPKEVPLEPPPNKDYPEPTNKDYPEPPNKDYSEHPVREHWEYPDEDHPEHQDEDHPEPSNEDSSEPPKETFLSCINKLFPETKQVKKSRKRASRKVIPPDAIIPKAVGKLCRWVESLGHTGIDEDFVAQQFKITHETPLTYDPGKITKVSRLPYEIKYSVKLDKINDKRFSLQAENLETKFQKPSDPYKPAPRKIRYGAWYLPPKTWKKLVNNEPWIPPNVLREEEYLHYGKYLEPDILDDLYGPIAFKDFIISKGYRMPEMIERLFFRKKWTYESVKTPIDRVIRLLAETYQDSDDEDEEEDEEEEDEEEEYESEGESEGEDEGEDEDEDEEVESENEDEDEDENEEGEGEGEDEDEDEDEEEGEGEDEDEDEYEDEGEDEEEDEDEGEDEDEYADEGEGEDEEEEEGEGEYEDEGKDE